MGIKNTCSLAEKIEKADTSYLLRLFHLGFGPNRRNPEIWSDMVTAGIIVAKRPEIITDEVIARLDNIIFSHGNGSFRDLAAKTRRVVWAAAGRKNIFVQGTLGFGSL